MDPSQDTASANIQAFLASTPFACRALTRLTGGNANHVFCGDLSKPLADGTSTIVIKKSEALSIARKITVDVSRTVGSWLRLEMKGIT